MSEKESKISALIREYLSNQELVWESIIDPRFESGFRFMFPKGSDPHGRPIGKNFVIVQPKNQDFVEISCGVRLSPAQVKALFSLGVDKRVQFFEDIKKIFLLKDVFYNIDTKNNKFAVIDVIYARQDGTISNTFFFKSVQKMFNCTTHAVLVLREYCAGKMQPEEPLVSKEQASEIVDFNVQEMQLIPPPEYRTVHIKDLKHLLEKLGECEVNLEKYGDSLNEESQPAIKEIRELVEKIKKEYDI